MYDDWLGEGDIYDDCGCRETIYEAGCLRGVKAADVDCQAVGVDVVAYMCARAGAPSPMRSAGS